MKETCRIVHNVLYQLKRLNEVRLSLLRRKTVSSPMIILLMIIRAV
jgi:hypothetical protein